MYIGPRTLLAVQANLQKTRATAFLETYLQHNSEGVIYPPFTVWEVRVILQHRMI